METHKDQMQQRLVQEREFHERELPQIHAAGDAAHRRPLSIAQGDSGQSNVIAQFLEELYNGPRFPFDMTNRELHEESPAVLNMDASPEQEIHLYFPNDEKILEKIAARFEPADFKITTN